LTLSVFSEILINDIKTLLSAPEQSNGGALVPDQEASAGVRDLTQKHRTSTRAQVQESRGGIAAFY
jgi:hypothetical protein